MPNLADSLTAKFTSAISHSINQSRSAPYFISVEAPAKWFAAGPRQSLNERERERKCVLDCRREQSELIQSGGRKLRRNMTE